MCQKLFNGHFSWLVLWFVMRERQVSMFYHVLEREKSDKMIFNVKGQVTSKWFLFNKIRSALIEDSSDPMNSTRETCPPDFSYSKF